MIDQEISNRLKEIMKKKYLTIADVANEAGVVYLTAKKLLYGLSVSNKSLRKILEVIKKYEQTL